MLQPAILTCIYTHIQGGLWEEIKVRYPYKNNHCGDPQTKFILSRDSWCLTPSQQFTRKVRGY